MSDLNQNAAYDSLTEREIEILLLISEGKSNQEIADMLHLTHGTVKWYASQIYSKLDVSNRAEAVTKAHELKLIQQEDKQVDNPKILKVVQPPTNVEQKIRILNSFDDTKIAYAVSGEGPPFIEVAHYLSHLEYEWESPIYRHLLHEFMRGHTLVRYDERGTGLSDWEVDDHSFEAWVRDLEVVVDATVAPSQEFPLFGKSQAGSVAVAYAAKYPERVSHLIVLGGYVCGANKRDISPVKKLLIQSELAMIKTMWDTINPAFRHFVAVNEFPNGPVENVKDMERIIQASSTANNILTMTKTMWDTDIREIAINVRVPTLIFHAIDDQVVPFAEGKRLASLIPNAEFVSLDTMNHLLVEGEPAWKKFQYHLRQFLRT